MIALPTAFLPSVHYLALIAKGEVGAIFTEEPFWKQSLRSRTHLLTANGATSFSLPLKSHGFPPPATSEIELSEHGHWRNRLHKTLCSTYSSAPFWVYYHDEIKRIIFEESREKLVAYNDLWLTFLCTSWEFEPPGLASSLDEGMHFHREILEKTCTEKTPMPRYWQVFEQSIGFTPHLSALDLLLHLGMEGRIYLQNLPTKLPI